MSAKLTIQDSIEFFIDYALPDITKETEVPKCNFIFTKEALEWLYAMKNNGDLSINLENLELLKKQNDPNCPNIYIKDHISFFSYITQISNSQFTLYEKHGRKAIPRQLLRHLTRRIWLRMGINDFNNVETFLKHQLAFLNDDTFYDYKFETQIDDFYNYKVTAQTMANYTWDESPRGIKFKIYDESDFDYHNLPHIFYGIKDDVCYIYAVQNDKNRGKIKKIERLLYKINKDIENPIVHPSAVYSMKLFVELLKEKGIKTIKIPTLQVLSYPYHEILSVKEQEKFAKEWTEERIEKITQLSGLEQQMELEEYEYAKKCYNTLVNKEDTISRLKTENLINLVYRVVNEDEELGLISDIDIDDSLIIKINHKVQNKKMKSKGAI